MKEIKPMPSDFDRIKFLEKLYGKERAELEVRQPDGNRLERFDDSDDIYTCPIYGRKVGDHFICECVWEYDGMEDDFPHNELYGVNDITVDESRENYKKYATSDLELFKLFMKKKHYEPLPITKLLTKDLNIK